MLLASEVDTEKGLRIPGLAGSTVHVRVPSEDAGTISEESRASIRECAFGRAKLRLIKWQTTSCRLELRLWKAISYCLPFSEIVCMVGRCSSLSWVAIYDAQRKVLSTQMLY